MPPEVGQARQLRITGCTHDVVGPIIRGDYVLSHMHHGKPAYKKEAVPQDDLPTVMIYFWDERDGLDCSGWWIGPQIGDRMVWGLHLNRASATPPTTGWQAPHNEAADPSIALAPVGPGGSGGAQPQQTQQNPQQMQMQQQIEQMQMQQLWMQIQRMQMQQQRMEMQMQQQIAQMQMQMQQQNPQPTQLQQTQQNPQQMQMQQQQVQTRELRITDCTHDGIGSIIRGEIGCQMVWCSASADAAEAHHSAPAYPRRRTPPTSGLQAQQPLLPPPAEPATDADAAAASADPQVQTAYASHPPEAPPPPESAGEQLWSASAWSACAWSAGNQYDTDLQDGATASSSGDGYPPRPAWRWIWRDNVWQRPRGSGSGGGKHGEKRKAYCQWRWGSS